MASTRARRTPACASWSSWPGDAHARSGRDPERFLVTVHTAFDERWLAADSPARDGLAAIGADRLILDLSPPYDRRRIAEAGRLLDG